MSHSSLVIAHRGVHGPGLIENTLAAFDAALLAGADMIEFDVRRTGGGELVVIHDHRHRGVAVDSVSLDQFEQRTGLRPPLLADVLDWASGRIALDVELKEDGYVEEVAALLGRFATRSAHRLLVTSFVDSVLLQLTELAPKLSTGLLLAWTAERSVERARDCGADVLLPELKLARESLLVEAAEADLDLIVWDHTPAAGAGLLEDRRVTGVITDDVAGSIALRDTVRM